MLSLHASPYEGAQGANMRLTEIRVMRVTVE